MITTAETGGFGAQPPPRAQLSWMCRCVGGQRSPSTGSRAVFQHLAAASKALRLGWKPRVSQPLDGALLTYYCQKHLPSARKGRDSWMYA